MEIFQLNIGIPKKSQYKNKEYVSGIGKKSIEEVYLSKDGFIGDGVANPSFHGGPDRAVCFYPLEHYQQWESEFDKEIRVPAFGENLTVTGMLERNICIGDIFQIGEVELQITQGRIPCSTISKYNELDPLLKRAFDTCYTGYFARVLKEGYVRNDSKIALIEPHPLKIDVYTSMYTYFHDFNQIAVEKILEVKELAMAMRENFERKLKKINSANY